MLTSEDDTASIAEVRLLIRRLIRLQDKWPTEPTLAHLSPRMVNGLLTYNGDIERGLPGLRLIFAMICSFCVVLWVKVPGILFLLTAAIPLMIAWMYRYDVYKEYAYAAYALTQTYDLRVLPTLLKATDHAWGRHAEVIYAIRRLLPLVTEAQAGLLSQKAQDRLWFLALPPVRLETGYDEALAVNAVQALARVGSRMTLNQMQSFARQPEVNRVNRRVNAVIEQLLPDMEERLKRQEVPQTLLRASEMPAPTSDTLLRATLPTSAEPTVQLLRASTSEPQIPDA